VLEASSIVIIPMHEPFDSDSETLALEGAVPSFP